MNAIPRSYLFVPGHRAERFDKALASGADAVVLDLEDAVAPDDKPRARAAIAAWWATQPPAVHARVVVRSNDAASPAFIDDLALLARLGVGGVMLPKAEAATQVAMVRAALPAVSVLALVESALGVARVDEVASAPGVTRLVFGTLDFALDLGIDIATDASGLIHAASRIAIASRVAGLPLPVAGVTPEIDDEARLLADLTAARALGFGAKLCIHPSQVAPLHRALMPSDADLDWAGRVLAADLASPGAARLDGRMVDRPVVLRAQRLLALATR